MPQKEVCQLLSCERDRTKCVTYVEFDYFGETENLWERRLRCVAYRNLFSVSSSISLLFGVRNSNHRHATMHRRYRVNKFTLTFLHDFSLYARKRKTENKETCNNQPTLFVNCPISQPLGIHS